MNRYELNMRSNVARNLVKLAGGGFPSLSNKSHMTRLEKDILDKGSARSTEIAKSVNRFLKDLQMSGAWTKITWDIRAKIEEEKASYGKSRFALTDNEVTKAKNWDSRNPKKNAISSTKVAAIRDWLTHIGCFVKFYAVNLTENERYFSIVDFLTARPGNDQDLQTRKKGIVPEPAQTLLGKYNLLRPSLHDRETYMRVVIDFKSSQVGCKSYELSMTTQRNGTEIKSFGQGFCFYANGCFQLTGRYQVEIGNRHTSCIDSYVLHDDSNNAELDGIWIATYIGDRRPLCVPVAVFSEEKFPELSKLPQHGRIHALPNQVKFRLDNASTYLCRPPTLFDGFDDLI